MSSPTIVLGYHGTTKKSADAILKPGGNHGDRFFISENEFDWLGDGVYFFQDAPNRAREWIVKHPQKNKRAKFPTVLCAELYLVNCLDLLDIKAAQFIANEYPEMKARYRSLRRKLPKNKGGSRRLDRYLINFSIDRIEEKGRRIDSVRAAFKEGDPIVPRSQIFNRAHVQIVVRPYHTAVIGKVWTHTFEET